MSAVPQEIAAPASPVPTPIVTASGLHPSDIDQEAGDTHMSSVGVRPSSSGQRPDDPQLVLAAAQPLAADQTKADTRVSRVGGEPPADSQDGFDPQSSIAVGNPSSPTLEATITTNVASGWTQSADGHASVDPQTATAVGNPPSSPTPVHAVSNERPSGWLNLRVWAEMFNDAQTHRIAATNRAERGGVHPAEYQPHIDALKALEHQCGLVLVRAYRRLVPVEIREWQKASPGIGEHSLARLLGHLGHPVHATPHVWIGEGGDRELKALEPYDRGVAQLWAYCGHGDPTCRRRKSMTADDAFALGNPRLKMIVHQLLAVACVKQPKGTVYRDVYDDARARYADRVDADDKPWTLLHQHNAALRFVGKRILRDLWIAGRES